MTDITLVTLDAPTITLVTLDAPTITLVTLDAPTITLVSAGLGLQGPPGITGSARTGSAITHPFSWGDATPATITPVPAGKKVLKVEVVLDVAFDVAAILTIGDAANHSRLLGVDDVDTQGVGTYQTNPGYKYISQSPANLYITLGGGTTTGSGLILIYIEA
jgi:hypothetical protein